MLSGLLRWERAWLRQGPIIPLPSPPARVFMVFCLYTPLRPRGFGLAGEAGIALAWGTFLI